MGCFGGGSDRGPDYSCGHIHEDFPDELAELSASRLRLQALIDLGAEKEVDFDVRESLEAVTTRINAIQYTNTRAMACLADELRELWGKK